MQRLVHENSEVEKVVGMSGERLTEMLKERFVGGRDGLGQEVVRLGYLERLLYIVCHSKKLGNPSNYVLFTIHTPSSFTLPPLPITPHPTTPTTKRTILPQLPCL